MSAPTIDELREQLFRALAILHVARHALTSKTEGFDPEECGAALAIVHEIVDDVAASLETIGRSGAVMIALDAQDVLGAQPRARSAVALHGCQAGEVRRLGNNAKQAAMIAMRQQIAAVRSKVRAMQTT